MIGPSREVSGYTSYFIREQPDWSIITEWGFAALEVCISFGPNNELTPPRKPALPKRFLILDIRNNEWKCLCAQDRAKHARLAAG